MVTFQAIIDGMVDPNQCTNNREFTEIYSSKFRISSYSHESFYNAQRAETLSRNSDVCKIRGERCLQPYRRQGLNLLLGDRGVGEGSDCVVN